MNPLNWTSLWLHQNFEQCRYRPFGAADQRLCPVPDEWRPDLEQIYLSLSTSPDSGRAKFRGVPCRAQRVRTVDGTSSYVLRRLPHADSLAALGVPPPVVNVLLDPGLRGLILVAGRQGAGKTTLAGALVQERIQAYGGVAFAIEDPPEMSIQETLAYGIIQQIAVDSAPDGLPPRERIGWHTRNAVRSSVDLLFVGEVRDSPEASAVVMQSGIGGPVITTIHADSVESALVRLIALAAKDMGIEGAAAQVAEHVAVVLHLDLSAKTVQTRRKDEEETPPLLVLTADMLRIEDRDSALRDAIRHQDFSRIREAALGQRTRRVQQQF